MSIHIPTATVSRPPIREPEPDRIGDFVSLNFAASSVLRRLMASRR